MRGVKIGLPKGVKIGLQFLKLAHGIHDATFRTKLRPERYQAFGRLHEITRFSLLGFLSMDSEKLKELSKSSGNSLQKKLNNLSPASGYFLKAQKIWASYLPLHLTPRAWRPSVPVSSAFGPENKD